MSAAPLPRGRAGMTLVEVVIALLIYGIVLAAAIGFVATQNSAFHQGLDRMTALRNARYALQILETDVMTLGTNVPGNQPSMIYAGPDVIAFAADYASNVQNDVFAAYIDPDAPAGQVTASTSSVSIPNTSFSHPDTLYTTGAGTRSPAEMLIFFFRLDSTTARSDDYVLFRQVNDAAPEMVAKDLLPPVGSGFFRYFKRADFATQPAAIDSIPDASLPVAHAAPIHGSPADTGSSALADSIRAVRLSFRSTNGLTGDNERMAEVSRLLPMPNAGFGVLETCGDPPILGVGVNAQPTNLGAVGGWVGRISWNPATDETMGEQDVIRYVIYRQESPIVSDWGDPYLSIPAGQASYEYLDRAVSSGASYAYALAAQDCTPSLSQLATSPTITIP